MDQAQLADFLRKRREALQPADVGLPEGLRRRTTGLRREEVASLCSMSVDYLSRLEQRRAPQPSVQMLAAVARGLHLTLDERDHLFRLAGHQAPSRAQATDHVDAGLMRVLDRLHDTAAVVMTALREPLMQTGLADALFGDAPALRGKERSWIYRWFTDVSVRAIYPPEDHPLHSRAFAAELRAALARDVTRTRAAHLVADLTACSGEFDAIWQAHEVGVRRNDLKRFIHPTVGDLELHCQILLDQDQSQSLLVFTAIPGTDSHDKLELLAVLGQQRLSS
jgi:transcriptional regulator with XRE-family HTH domain